MCQSPAQSFAQAALALRRKHADVGKMTVFVVEVEPITHHELIRDGKADEVGFERHFLPPALPQEHADFYRGRAAIDQVGDHARQRLPRIKNVVEQEDLAIGQVGEEFVADFEAGYGYVPASYAAQSYDSAVLLDSAIRKVGGKLGDKDALRTALRAADFKSVRGNFRFGANHYPVQDFWLCQVAKRPDGRFQTETVRRVLENDTDPWAAECRMR